MDAQQIVSEIQSFVCFCIVILVTPLNKEPNGQWNDASVVAMSGQLNLIAAYVCSRRMCDLMPDQM